jgi:hypothetical protein
MLSNSIFLGILITRFASTFLVCILTGIMLEKGIVLIENKNISPIAQGLKLMESRIMANAKGFC